MRSLNIGATGMLAQQTNVDVISNNIANMNTTAYSKRRAEFNDLLYQTLSARVPHQPPVRLLYRQASSWVPVSKPRPFTVLQTAMP